MRPLLRRSVAVTLLVFVPSAWATSPEDAKGLWITAEKDGVLEFQSCADNPATLCGHVVWDKDAGTPRDTCGVQIAQLGRYDGTAWRDGWVYDPRTDKKYKGALRMKSGELHIRAFIGTELLGQTERLQRVAALPAHPACPR